MEDASSEEILAFLRSQIFSNLPEEEKRKLALKYSNGLLSDYNELEAKLLKSQIMTSLLSLPKDVFVENIINNSNLKGKNLVSLCASDPYIRDVCKWKEGMLYRKLIEKETGIVPEQNLTFNELSDLYMSINNGFIYFNNYQRGYLERIPGIQNVTDLLFNDNHYMYIDIKGDLYSFTIEGKKDYLGIGNLARLFSGQDRNFCLDREGEFYEMFMDNRIQIKQPKLKSFNLFYDPAKIKEVFYFLDCLCVLNIENELYYVRAPEFKPAKGFLKLDIGPIRKIISYQQPLDIYILTIDGKVYKSMSKYTIARLGEYVFNDLQKSFKLIDMFVYKQDELLLIFENGDVYYNNTLIFNLKGVKKGYILGSSTSEIYRRRIYLLTDKFRVYKLTITKVFQKVLSVENFIEHPDWRHFGRVFQFTRQGISSSILIH